MDTRTSSVLIRETNTWHEVQLNPLFDKLIRKDVVEKWQDLINVTAEIFKVPSALIMELKENTIKVFLKNTNFDNPYEQGEEASLDYGLYCETVIGNQEMLIVPNALESTLWSENNPDVSINMISYLGLPLNWPGGEVFGTVCVLDNKYNNYNRDFINFLSIIKQSIEKDIELMVRDYQLKKSNEELKKANDVKTQFLSMLSHDLRGPIGNTMELLNILPERIATMPHQQLSAMLQSMANGMKSTMVLLEGMLIWSVSKRLHLAPVKESVDLKEVIQKTIELLDSSIKLKEQVCKVNIATEKGIIIGDNNMIETSIRNIISNAIKYTATKGQISISLKQENDKTIVEIIDTGIGISEEKLQKIYNVKTYVKDKGTNSESSAGLGLIIAKEFIEANGGAIDIDSKVGEGSTFIISF